MKAVFITGASKGIGKGIADAFLKQTDYTVFNISRSNTVVNPRLQFLQVDLSDKNALLNFNFPDHDYEKIVLINNAGTLGELKHAGAMSDTSIFSAYMVNVVAPHVLINKFIKHFNDLIKEKIIINISSGAASSVYDGWSVYCASKSAIDQMSRVIDHEQDLINASSKFKVYAIAPGVVETAMQQQLRKADEADFSRKAKFIELKDNQALYTPAEVGQRFVELIENTESIDGVISRISI
ncbi:MAG: SDR family NAD(P)-dependent oxidoreductase [Chitinophagales bacterium]|nr:SDR family NAD(P)-dependent oxidoreductase [Chitinophagales bacterium]